MLNGERFIVLLDKYVANEIAPEERSELFAAISSGEYDELLARDIDRKLQATTIEGTNLPPHRSAEILHKILSSEKQNLLLLPKTSGKIRVFRWAAVAAVASAIIFSIYFIRTTPAKNVTSSPAVANNLLTKINTSEEPIRVQLEDGSFITLQPGSAIHYPVHFLSGKREVFLDGEAFFEVSKNPNRPFYVFNKNIVTHVLGTSFTIKTNKETKQLEVSVRSGRVEVYESTTPEKDAPVKRNNGVILLPNQRVIYDETARQFVPSLVDKPLPVIDESADKKIPAENSIFEETPLKTVLPFLEKSYGIEIVVENEDLYKCLFTGDIHQQDLYTRLDVVCQATGASYEIKGTKILIKGKGCN